MRSRFAPFFLAAAVVGALALAGCADSPGYYSVRAGAAAPYYGYYDDYYHPYDYYGSYYVDRPGYVYPQRYRHPTRVYGTHPHRYRHPTRYRRTPTYRYDHQRYRRTPTYRYDRQRYRPRAGVHRRAPVQWRSSSRDRVRPPATYHRTPSRATPPRQRVRDDRR